MVMIYHGNVKQIQGQQELPGIDWIWNDGSLTPVTRTSWNAISFCNDAMEQHDEVLGGDFNPFEKN